MKNISLPLCLYTVNEEREGIIPTFEEFVKYVVGSIVQGSNISHNSFLPRFSLGNGQGWTRRG